MTVLYPPQINEIIPAFYGGTLTVPFSMNATVGDNDYIGFQLYIKSIYDNKIVINDLKTSNIDKLNHIATFSLDGEQIEKLNIGTHYKIQMAYYNDDTVGYFSQVATIKYTAAPVIKIGGLDNKITNLNQITYYGEYSNIEDNDEKVYSYRFDVYKGKDQLLYTTGDLLHNHEKNTRPDQTIDVFKLTKTLKEYETYYIQYSVKTTNGLICSSPRYKIIEQSTVKPIETEVRAIANYEEGYIDIELINKNSTGGSSGLFVIVRAEDTDNYGDWKMIKKFAMFGEPFSNHFYRDFTIEQGKTYKYALQQYSSTKGWYSSKIISNEVYSDFEHCYLYDGERQLKIKYNPKISSFKQTLQESKSDTIGSKYPYFFRNGNVGYKEFPISGLISYQMDDNEFFIDKKELGLEEDNLERSIFYHKKMVGNQKLSTTNLVDYNMNAERIFKMKVLEFLTNGKPKLFKSPAEGNYIVRLMNTSLTPNDQLGRMLHTFQCTAYEIDEFNYEKLGQYGFINITEPERLQMRWSSIDLFKKTKDINTDDGGRDIELNNEIGPINYIQCVDMLPGQIIKLDSNSIVIGSTGSYEHWFETPINKVLIYKPKGISCIQGIMTFGYYKENHNSFDYYKDFSVETLPAIQLLGPALSFIQEDKQKEKEAKWENDILEYLSNYHYYNSVDNTIDFVKNWQYPTQTLLYLHFSKKTQIESFGEKLDDLDLLHFSYDKKNSIWEYYSGNSKVYESKTGDSIDYKITIKYKDEEKTVVDLDIINEYYLDTELDNIETIQIGNGVILNLGLRRVKADYNFIDWKDDETYIEYLAALDEEITKLQGAYKI